MSDQAPLELDENGALLRTHFSLPHQSGKVRDVYDLGDRLLIISTDRISAFDWILPNGIPLKGNILTQLSRFWFDRVSVPHHLLSVDIPTDLNATEEEAEILKDRIMVVRKASVVPFECVIRGYIEGSGWKEYQKTEAICGIRLPAGLVQADQLPKPIFTPATKAEEGHDENVSEQVMTESVGEELTQKLRDLSLKVYTEAAQFAKSKGLIIADTKFEWGQVGDEIFLIDEVLTPDSSRFWPIDDYQPGRAQVSFDKQYVREWLSATDWDRNSPPPQLPTDVVQRTAAKYQEAIDRLTS